MADTVPAKLKGLQLAPFAKRAAQLERFKPIITYWLRFYIVQKIIAAGLHSADEECMAYTTSLMEKLEQAKADNPNEDALLDDAAASAYCEQFALHTFAKGEKEMAENRATNNTADTLLAASTFLEILSVWKRDSDPEIANKAKFAKYHALRILKAVKANEDPNLSNPVQETPQQLTSPPPLDPTDPEVQSITQGAPAHPPPNPYQPYVESAPNTSAPPSPTFSASRMSPPPPSFPPAPSAYTQPSHNDVSPISQPGSSRKGSVASVGGGYFPKMDAQPPTFTAETTEPGHPTAPSMETNPLTVSSPASSQTPQAPGISDPSSFYQNPSAPPATAQPPPLSPPPQNPFQSPSPSTFPSQPQNPGDRYQSQVPAVSPQPPPQIPPQQPASFHTTPAPAPQQYSYASPTLQHHVPQRGTVGVFPAPNQPQQQPPTFPAQHQQQQYSPAPRHNPYAQPSAPPPQAPQGPYRTDDESITDAQKHAKWAISALNFEDVPTAVKELRIALRALGAS
ncbi:DUF605-domain-containing protein [Pyrenochaeta sp. DS3sAY3a]|nr:DUF605-domain-containing protein [Pyrenochaeta sp. DS3sAY3a]